MRTKTLWIKDNYLEMILSGRKTIEVRVAYSNITHLAPGDRLMLNEEHAYRIERIGRYENFEELLANEELNAIAPGLTYEQLLKALGKIYPPEKEALGVIALVIRPETI
jgi:ASC-1-like (ASCH) protein